MKTKYHIFLFPCTEGDPISITVDKQIDKRFKKVVGVQMYTSTVLANNINLNFEKDFKIDSEEVYPENFDSAMLFPVKQNEEFTKLSEPIELNNYKLEGKFSSIDVAPANCVFKIMLKLEVGK
ncbi:MAG: hypothetical protein PHE56_08175 [Bacteroidales bacterium]|nr:hypothetical protein [Bacteroidales bacterium]